MFSLVLSEGLRSFCYLVKQLFCLNATLSIYSNTLEGVYLAYLICVLLQTYNDIVLTYESLLFDDDLCLGRD